MKEQNISVYTTDQIHQSEIIRSLLQQNEIEPFILNKRDSMYPVGYIEVFVSENDAEKARKIIEDAEL
jgi:hypothetical protein